MLARSTTPALLLVSLLGRQVAAHGAIIQPWTRSAGEKSKEVCGQQWYNDRNGHDNANNKMGPIAGKDLAGNVLPEACNWRLCGGAQFEDNREHVYTWQAGTEVPIEIFSLNRHGGVANVSVVDTATNTVIGSALKEWTDGKYLENDFSNTCPSYPPLDEVSFNVTVPALGNKCTEPGACVLQWYWYSEKANDQTFESCIDFVQPFEGSPAAAPVTEYPSTESWYRYCSPHSTTIDYWNATASIPLAINTQFLDFAADVITAVASVATATASDAMSGVTSTAFASASGSIASAGSPSLAESPMPTPMASSGSSVGSAGFAQQTDAAFASSSIDVDASAASPTSTATFMSGPAVPTSIVSSAFVEMSVDLAAGSSSIESLAETETSKPTTAVDMSSSAAPMPSEASSSFDRAFGASLSSSRSKTACRARTSSWSSPSATTATHAPAPAVASSNTEESAESSSTSYVEAGSSSSGNANEEAETDDDPSVSVEDVAASPSAMACTEPSTVTVTETSTVTATVYIELIPVGTSTGLAPVASQTLAPVPANRRRAASIGHGVFKRRHGGGH